MLALLVAGNWIVSAHAQPTLPDALYRNDGTTVLQDGAVTADAQSFDAERFRVAYGRAGRPRFVVLWNRELSDELDQRRSTRTTIEPVTVTAWQSGSDGYLQGVIGPTRITTEEVRPGGVLHDGPAKDRDARVRNDFFQTLMANGVRLVDRNVAMRSVAARDAQSKGHDSQHVEMAALQQHAQYLIEVTGTPDPAAMDGWALSVTVKSLVDESVMETAYFDGKQIPAGPPKFVADPAGGYRAVGSMQRIGQAAAEQVLVSLVHNWRRQ